MRLVRVIDPTTGVGVELHPRLTVLSGLPAQMRAALAATASAIPRGVDAPLQGSVEVHGILMDLDRANLALLELTHDVDVVLRAADLPGAEPPVSENLTDTERGGTEGAEMDPAVAHAKDQMAAAAAVNDDRGRFLGGLRSDHEHLAASRAALVSELERTRSDIDSFALAGLKVARDELATLELELRTPQVIDRRAERRHIELRLDELITSADTVRREIRRLEAIDVAAVRRCRDVLGEEQAPVVEPLREAIDLANSLRSVDQQLAALHARLAGARQQIAELTDRRDAAHAELLASERALRAPELDPAVVEELERVHDEIFDLDGRESKVGASRARRRLAELKAEEEVLLHRLGFDTWASYVMGVSSADAEAERIHRHEVAKATYEFAEDELARAAAQPSDEVAELATLSVRRDEFVRSAIRIVGPGDAERVADSAADSSADLVARLEAHRVRVAAPDQTPARVAELRAALEAADVELPNRDLAADEIAILADGWLETMTEVAGRLERLREQHRSMEHEIDTLAAELESVPEQETIEKPIDDDHPDLIAARLKIAEGEQRLERHRAAVGAVADLQRRIDDATARSGQLATNITEAEKAVETATRELAAARAAVEAAIAAADERAREVTASLAHQAAQQRSTVGVESVEWYVLARLAAQRSLSFVGSVPLVIDDAFVDWPTAELADVLTRLERMSEVIQVVFVTEDVEIAEWARRLGSDRAQVITPAA